MARSGATARPSRPSRKRRRGRRLIAALLIVLIVLGAGVWLLGPTIASPIAAGIIQQQVSKQIAGSVRVSDVALSWTGHQRVGAIELRDPQGQLVGKLTIDVDAGLIGLARGSRDLGASTLTGELDIVRSADGTTNLQRALAPTTPPTQPSTPPSVPAGFGIDLAIQSLEITLTDVAATVQPTKIVVEGGADARAGQPATLDLSAQVNEPSLEPGTVTLAGTIQSWSRSDGVITPDALTLDATLRGTDLPVASADRIAQLDGALVEALGDRLAWTATISGGTQQASVVVSAGASHANASFAARLSPSTVELTAPATVTLRTDKAIALAPALAGRLDAVGETITLDEAPTLTLRIDALRARLDEDSGVLVSLEARASAAADAMTGTIAPDAGTDAPRRFAVSPLAIDLAVDAAGTATLTSRTTATIDSLNAGALDVSLTLADAIGTRAFDARALAGTVALTGLDAKLVEPFVAGTGIRVATDIGPTLAARLDISPAGQASNIDLALDADQLTGTAALTLGDDTLAARSSGVSLTAARGGALLAAVLDGLGDGQGGPALRPTGSVTLGAHDLVIPVRGDSLRARLDEAAGTIELGATGLVLAPPPSAQGTPDLAISSATLTAQLAPGAPPRATLDAAIRQGDQQGTASGELTVASLGRVLDNAGTPARLGLAGTIELAGLDHALVGWMPASIRTTSGGDLDLAQLAEQAWGPTLGATLALSSTDAGVTNATLTARGRWSKINAQASLASDTLQIHAASVSGRLGLHAFRTLAEGFGPAWHTPPRLDQPAPYELRIEPTTIALGDGAPPATLRAGLTMPRTTIIGTSLLRDDGTEFRPGPVTLDQAVVTAQLPLGNSGQSTTIRAQLGVEDRTGSPVARITAQLDASVDAQATTPGGPTRLHAAATIDEVDPAWLGAIAGRDRADADLLTGVLGGRARAELTYDRDADQQTIGLALDAPSLRTSEAMTLIVEPTRIRLDRPVRLTGQLAPETLSRLALGADSAVAFDRSTPWTVQLDRIDLPRATDQDTKPLVVSAGVSMPELGVALDDGSRVVYRDVAASIRTDPNDAAIVRLDASASTQQSPKALAVRAMIHGLGGPASDETTIDLDATLDDAPTALLDALLATNGVLADALGPTASASITATDLSRAAGTLDAQLTSPLASGRVRGRVGAGVLELDEPATVSVSRFGPGLMRRLAALSPMVGQIEKRPEDGPATLTIADLRMPTDGDLRKLDAHLTLDIGTARFKASDAFAPLLGVVDWQADTTIGRRLTPLVVTIDKGVARTEGFTLPLGEFAFESRGSYDLVTKRVDVVTLIPLGLLSDDVARAVEDNTRQVAGVLGQVGLTMEPVTKIPFRLRGPIASAKPEFDAQLLVDEFLGDQLKPENIIKNQAGDLLDGLFGGKPKQKKNDGGG